MSFNPAKCEVLRISRKKYPAQYAYTIHGEPLKAVENTKYLGLNINKDLSWNHHINSITKKANSTVGFLRRNISKCPSKVKKQAYVTFVRPSIEYAATVWHTPPNTSKGNKKQLEAVQRRAARFICSNWDQQSSPTAMLASHDLPALEKRRDALRLVMMYKIAHGEVAIPKTLLQPSGVSSRGHPQRFLLPYSRVNAHMWSFFPATIRLWNILPENIVLSPSTASFQSRLHRWLLPTSLAAPLSS